MRTFRVVAVGIGTLISAVGIQPSCFGAGSPPYFTSYSPLTQWVYLDRGQRSLEITGTAVDQDNFDTLRFVPSGVPSFMTFQSIDGNPGQFRITANNLNSTHVGSYFFDVVVLDSAIPPEASSLRYAVGIVPEPALALGLLPMLMFSRSRR